jgi:AcrR family transcriptional regulator
MAETSQNKNLAAPTASQNEQEQSFVEKIMGCRKRDRSASEERLVDAGLEIFSKYGFNGATTKMIAKKADCNESLIGRYFDGKEGLLMAITQKFIAELIQRELPYEPKDSLTEELTAYVKDRFQSGCEKEDFAKMLISQSLTDKKFRKRVVETIPMQMDPRLIQRINLLASKGKLKPGTVVQDLCYDIDTFMDGMFFMERILHETPLDQLIEQTLRFVKTYSKIHEA